MLLIIGGSRSSGQITPSAARRGHGPKRPRLPSRGLPLLTATGKGSSRSRPASARVVPRLGADDPAAYTMWWVTASSAAWTFARAHAVSRKARGDRSRESHRRGGDWSTRATVNLVSGSRRAPESGAHHNENLAPRQGPHAEPDAGECAYRASGSGRSWKWYALGVVPFPPSMWNGARVLMEAHRPRPFQPASGSSMRPSSHLV